MTRNVMPMMIVVLVLAASCAQAWEVMYDAGGGVLPSSASPAWAKVGGNGVQPTIANGALHIIDATSADCATYQMEQWAILAGTPVTMEARMRVTAYSDPLARGWTTVMSIQTQGAYALLYIYPDHVSGGGLNYAADFSSYRTIRMALDGLNHLSVWVDAHQAFSLGIPQSGGQSGVMFGAGSVQGTSSSSWQYVAYSKQFLPLPEPSSLLALLAGLGGLSGIAWRRRR